MVKIALREVEAEHAEMVQKLCAALKAPQFKVNIDLSFDQSPQFQALTPAQRSQPPNPPTP